ncbi:alpha/beta fold hydrolase [Halomicrobium salinisoli]|uniref:alpha/beta fold hydrolase n=1 Tax=Halomicrobium salinisoli TaxID=2878391 RepID=UPI001CF01E5A|nr:alpha/beta hydrolase [Halomicrobium salinisoli]
MQTVTSADGTEIGYETQGEGRPVVLVHGTSTTRESWTPVVPHLAEEFRVVVPDRRGRGESGDADAYDLDREVADVRAVLDDVDGEPALVGQSFGGLCALEAARRADVSDLALYEPAVVVGDHRRETGDADRMESLLAAGERREAVELAMGVMTGDEGAPGAAAVEAALPVAGTIPRELRAVATYELPADLDVDARTLLLTGDRGPTHLRDAIEVVDERLPDSRLVEFEGLGHVFQADDPGRVAEEIRAFLAAE